MKLVDTYQDAAPVPFHSQLSGQASFALCTDTTGHCECTSHNLVELGLFVFIRVRSRYASRINIEVGRRYLPHLTFRCLQSSHLDIQSVQEPN